MNTPRFLHPLALAVISVALGIAPAAEAARIKCWTNDEGVRECGNVVPPKYAQRGHQRVNRQGIVVGRERRAKTQEELAEEARQREKEEAEAAERERLARAQAAKDRVLLDTFTSEDELVLAHQGRLAAIDSRVKHARQIVSGLQSDLGTLEQDAARQERSGKAVSEELNAQITETQSQIGDQWEFIRERHREKAELEEQFEKDLHRYRELKGR